jgi:hypothetical protein
MILIREVFIAKPGMASKLAKLMREVTAKDGTRVMTDLASDFNKVVMETEVPSLAEVDRRMQEYAKDKSMQEKMKGYTDMYLTGRREVYQILS